MPNSFAYLVLCAWPLVSAYFFRRLSPARAVIWTILGGYLFLPPATFLDLPLLPDVDKIAIPNICAFVGFLATKDPELRVQKSILFKLALALFLLTPIGTILTNPDFIPFAVGGLPGMAIKEIPGFMLTNFVLVMPALIGYQLLRDEEAMRDLLVALVLAGLIYSVPMLVEVRLSPQINVWVYGFFQHAFDQMMRYGGFRPIVFLPHGLWAAFFAFMAAFAAVSVMQSEPNKRQRNLLISLYLIAVLVLCKSANAITYIMLFVPIALFLPVRLQMRIAAVVGTIVLCYPILRGSGLIPTAAIADFAASIDADRAGSLIFRLTNEDLLLGHASQRPWFGWGGWGRSLIHDPITGRMISTIDGQWIVTIGITGWFGYLGEMGLLTLPLIMLAIHTRDKVATSCKYGAGVALILTANVIDLIPNATLIPFTWLMAGSLLGYAEAMRTSPREVPVDASATRLGAAPWARGKDKVSALNRPPARKL